MGREKPGQGIYRCGMGFGRSIERDGGRRRGGQQIGRNLLHVRRHGAFPQQPDAQPGANRSLHGRQAVTAKDEPPREAPFPQRFEGLIPDGTRALEGIQHERQGFFV